MVDVGANVGMASFAAAAMGFRVVAFEPVFESFQKICEGIYFNRVANLVTLFEVVASDRHREIEGGGMSRARATIERTIKMIASLSGYLLSSFA